MATKIVQLTTKSTGEYVYTRTSSDAVNCNTALWQDQGIVLNPREYADPATGQKKTRVLLTDVLGKVPELIDKKIEPVRIALEDRIDGTVSNRINSLALDTTGDALVLKSQNQVLSTIPLNPRVEVLNSQNIADNSTYQDLLQNQELRSEEKALSAAAVVKMVDKTVGWTINAADSI